LIDRPFVDGARSGLLGTCVGGSFAIMAAASPLIRDRVAFVSAFAPYSSIWTFAQDVASATRLCGDVREPWAVDPITREVYVRSLTAVLDPSEADRLRCAFSQPANSGINLSGLSDNGRAVLPLLQRTDPREAEVLLHGLPTELRQRLEALSPLAYVEALRAPLITFGHDRDDLVIPVGESRRLLAALSGRSDVHYTEFGLFQHADPTKRKLSPLRLLSELAKFYRFVYPLHRLAAV
jgi:hypothetical protein